MQNKLLNVKDVEDSLTNKEEVSFFVTSLFVSTSLDFLTVEDDFNPKFSSEALFLFNSLSDLAVKGKVYRRLSPEYYAWLRSRVSVAVSAAKTGKLKSEDVQLLTDKFLSIHSYATENFTAEELKVAAEKLNREERTGRKYDLPSSFVEMEKVRLENVKRATEFEAKEKVTSQREIAEFSV